VAGPYSAGTVFLQVVPSYENMQRTLGRDARKIGESLGQEMGEGFDQEIERGSKGRAGRLVDTGEAKKAGETAGRQYGGAFERELQSRMSAAYRSLPKVKVGTDTDEIDREMTRIRQQFERLSKMRIGVDVDSKEALTEITALENRLRRLGDNTTDIEFHIDAASALKQVAALRSSIAAVLADKFTVEIGVNEGAFEKKMRAQLAAAQARLPKLRIDADSSAAVRSLDGLQKRMALLQGKRIGIDIDSNRFLEEINVIRMGLDALPDHEDISVQANIKGAMADLAIVQAEAARVDATRAEPEVNLKGFALVMAQYAKIRQEQARIGSSGGSAANAFRAFNGYILAAATIGPALIPILGAIAGGLLAIGPAAMGGMLGLGILIAGFSGLGAAVTALRNVQKQQAKDSLAAEKTNRTALKGVADAQRSAANAIRSALRQQEDAERSLADAQRDAKRAQEDLVQARIQAARDIEDLNSRARAGKLDERQGLIDVFNATVADTAARQDPGATNLEREQAAINLERARLALEDTRRANKGLAEEQAKVAKQGVDGTQRVQTAQEQVANAIRRQQDAVRNLGEASEAVDRARIDGAQRVSDALAAQAEATQKTGEIGSAAMVTLQDEMSKLGPAGQHFVYFLADMQDKLYAFRDAIQEGLLPGVEDALSALIDRYGAGFTRFLSTMGVTLGDIFRQTADVLQGPAFSAFFAMMEKDGPLFTQQLADITLNLSEAFANIMTALAPFSKDFGDALVNLSDKFKTWTESLADSKAFQDFLEYARREGPRVMRFIGALLGAVLNIAEALAPYADKILSLLTGFLDWIAGMDPKLLGPFLVVVLALVGGIQLAAGAISAFASALGVAAILTGITEGGLLALMGTAITAALPFIAIAAVIAAVAIGLVILYKKSETFRDIVNGVFFAVRDAAIWMWDNGIKPALNWIVDAWHSTTAFIADQWERRVKPVFELFGAIVSALWRNILSPTFGWIGDRFGDLGSGIKWVWDHVLKPVFDFFMDVIGDDLVSAFETGVGLIGKAWDKIKELAKAPVKFVVNTVLNDGILGAFNWLAGKFGTTKIPLFKLPEGFATGGVYPGYTPGRDIGYIGVSGGEAIMRPEWTRAMGHDYVEYMNRAARTGGVAGVRKAAGFLGGFAAGGVAGGSGSGHPFGGQSALIAFGRLLQQMGFRVAENPYFGGVHPVHARNSLHYSGNAIDVNWAPGTSAAEQREIDKLLPLAAQYGLRVIWRVKDHFNHAHFDTANSADMVGDGAGGGGVWGFLKGLNPVEWFQDKIGDIKAQIEGKFGDNDFITMLTAVPMKIVDMAKDAIIGMASAAGDWIGDKAGDALGAVKGLLGFGDKAVGEAVREQAAKYGWGSGGQWEALQALINKESSFDPDAKNPSSSAYGLFQFLDSTWGTVGGKKTSDPEKQALYGMRYIKANYGTPESALKFHNARGWYSEGGVVPEGTQLYDSGGILPPGISSIVNASGKPEAILTNEQFRNLERIANGGGGLTVDARSYGSDLDANDVAEEMLWAVRRMQQGGRYAFQGAGIGAMP
jgi:hypothetical protein